MLNYLLNAPRPTKRLITLCYDACIIPLALYTALALRHGEWSVALNSKIYITTAITTSLTLIIFTRTGLYRAVIRYMASKAFSTLALGITLSTLVLATSSFITHSNLPRSSIIIYWFTAFALLGGPRIFVRNIVNQLNSVKKEAVLIYGAGNQGIELASALINSDKYRAIAFLDDSHKKQKTLIHSLKVHSPDNIAALAENHNVKKVLLALGNTNSAQRKKLIERISNTQLEVLTTPAMQDIISGKAKIEEIKEIEIEDLLGRDSVTPDQSLLRSNVQGKVVLVTGAGGSIGSELCRQIVKLKPLKLVLIELNEYSLYNIEQELNNFCQDQKLNIVIASILGSIQNKNRLTTIFKTFNVETIYHAAAYKHVPMVEHNVVEGVRNNAFGTWYCAEAAISANVKNFVLISTDKAVRPTNIMGTSKRLAELVLQALSQRQNGTRFCMVRFGNVLGSSGSVVPLFHKQIKQGGPITVTHPDITRYFMTIPEAAMLVIQAGSMGKGGDVFVLDMGEPVKITALAQKMIRLSGLSEKTENEPNGDIQILFSGLRPGEKLYEELLIGRNVEGTTHKRIMTAKEVHLSWPETHNLLSRLDTACHEFQVEEVINILLKAPAAFNKQGNDNPDWVHCQNIKNDDSIMKNV
ncbi:MAG: nucleoside-diphosphate sugar epimerase/dehydratase [Colwellia sp.]